jgi:serine/threonine protein kinase
MAETKRCPGCGLELPAHAPETFCPACLLRQGMESEAARSSHESEPDATAAPSGHAPVAPRPILEGPGSRIGPYKLLQEIGEGGMGVVYMAEQEKPVRRRVALKIIKPGMDTSQVIARFEAERQALALMDHQHIAKVLDAGATDTGRPYFVMELVRGVPITEYCDRNHLTPKERLELFVPVCNAIQHAHQKGVIHRDIKPSNVLVTLYDGKPVAKVIDFGVAKATDQRLTERTMFTQFGQVIGTLEYMSPEQAEMGALDIDSRSDIYSLGVMLYELLTGSTPLQRAKLRQAAYVEILRRIREDETPKPSTRLSESRETLTTISAQRKTEPARLAKLVRGELDWIVMRALEKDRVRRYDTANAFARDIQRYLDGDPVEAGPPSATYRLRKFARKYRPWIFTAAAFAALLVLATAISGWMAFRAIRAEAAAKAERNRALDAEKVAQADRIRALDAERKATELTERALIAERKIRAELERVANLVRRVKEATVYIRHKVGGRTLVSGTGFVIEATRDSVLLATSRRIVVPDTAEIPGDLVPKGSAPEIEAVFPSGEGTAYIQRFPAQIVAVDTSEDLSSDLAFLVVTGLTRPPAPMNILNRLDPTEGMAYLGAGFPAASMFDTSVDTKGNPSLTITRGGIAALRRDERGRLTLLQMDGLLMPGDNGGPIVEEGTGTVIGVGVSQVSSGANFIGVPVARLGSGDPLGFVIPADEIRRALDGRVGAMDLTLDSIHQRTADLHIEAQLVDPKGVFRAMTVLVAPVATDAVAPDSDGVWQPLPQSKEIELQLSRHRSNASGQFQVTLRDETTSERRIFVQTAHRGRSGHPVYSQPAEYDLPAKPGLVPPPLMRLVRAERRLSLALLEALVDPDKDCKLFKDENNMKIKIEIPGNTLHTLAPELVALQNKEKPLHNAPMSLIEVDGDFAALVQVTGEISPGAALPMDRRGNHVSSTVQGAGLILYQDKNNFVRLERTVGVPEGSHQPMPRLLLDVVKDGKHVTESYEPVPEGRVYLLLIRRKGRIMCGASPNLGGLARSLQKVGIQLRSEVEIGLSATNISANPFTATFEDFALFTDLTNISARFADVQD